MDKAHARAVEALQPFIHLANANSATSPRFVANLITNATSNPHTYVFGELLETSTIQSLSSPDTPPEYKIYLKLLEIFAWGTWEEYENYQGTPRLPELSFEQAQKLRLLSLLSLAKTIKPLTYSALMTHLSLKTPGELESLVTTAIYSSLLTARLSPAATPPTINVTAVAPLRDVQPQSLPAMISVLEEWQTRCGNVVSHLETEIQNVKLNAAKRAVREAAYQRSFDEALEKRKAAAPGGGVAGVGNAGGSGKGEGRRRGRRGFWGMGNKREADDIDHDDGFFDAGEGMDIDEGAGATGTASGRGIGSRTKRILAGGRQG